MRRRRKTTLELGTISEGTLRAEDLIPAYVSTLESIRLTRAERTVVRAIARDAKWEREECDDLDSDVEELTTILENHCPDYAYFGTLEGDGACFGVWPAIAQLAEDSDEVCHADGVLKMNAGDPFPPTASCAYVMAVTDHGNVTLYRRAGRRWIECWSVA